MEKLKLALLDDHPLILEGISSTFRNCENAEIVFSSSDPDEFMEKLKTISVDLLIIDVVIPKYEGIQFFKLLRTDFPELSILVYSSLTNKMLIENLFNIGVMGYVFKNDSSKTLLEAVHTISVGKRFLPAIFANVIPIDPNQVVLSDREIEILKLISLEFSSIEIAAKLFISENTVEKHRKTLFVKLQVKNAAGLIREGINQGYISSI